ncbi:MAG: hypothetical protein ABEJ59_05790 [Halanaeroarchaeum sp.]
MATDIDLRALVLGRGRDDLRDGVVVALALFALTFAAYALGVLAIEGGVVLLARDAAIVGAIGAGWLGGWRTGLLPAWVVAYGALLGAHADFVFRGLGRRPLVERLALFFELDALGYLAVQAVAVGSLAYGVGWLAGWAMDRVRAEGGRV